MACICTVVQHGDCFKATEGGKCGVVLAVLQRVNVLLNGNNISTISRVASLNIVVHITTRYGAGRSRDRIPVEARLSAPVQTGPEAHPAPYTMGTGSFPGVKRPERGVDHPPLLARSLKKEQSCTTTPPLSLRGLL